MNAATEKKNQRISGVLTIVITVLLFLLMFWYQFSKTDLMLSEEGAVAVAYGDPDAGGPNDVPVEPSYTPPTPSKNEDNAQEQSNDEDAVATKKTEDTKKKIENKVTPKETPKEKNPDDDLLKKAMEAKKNQQKQNSGDGSKSGTQGDPKGTGDNNKGGDGGGTGTTGSGTDKSGAGKGGVTHSFKGRSFSAGTTSKNCNKQGKVVVDVILKPDGTIVYDGINPQSQSDNCLEEAAKEIIRKSRFNSSETTVSVEGTITINFKLN